MVDKASKPPQLPIVFDDVREKNLEQLKLLNSVIFPIKYQEKMYQDVLACGSLSQYAYHNDVLVGAIACRAEKTARGTAAVYIMTMGVLAPYRSMGVGSRLLERTLSMAAEDANITEALLHVQANNKDAIRFYERFGFVVKQTVKDYYKRLDPPDAVLLVKELRA